MAATMRERTGSPTAQLHDQELVQAIHRALYQYDPIRSSDSPIQVTSADGVVTLTGIVRSRTMKSMAETLTRRVRGVADVRNQLLTDTDIETTIALEIAMHERLREAGGAIRVKSILGAVYLAGDVAAETVEEAEELKELAEEIAENAPGVTQVINSVIARERGQVVTAAVEEEEAGGLSAEQEAKLAELRERRSVWAERTEAGG